MTRKPRGLEECPNCGASFPAGRLACPECGSDARTGWQSAEEIDYQEIDLPDFQEPTDAEGRAVWKRRPRWMLWAAVLALVGFVLAFVLR